MLVGVENISLRIQKKTDSKFSSFKKTGYSLFCLFDYALLTYVEFKDRLLVWAHWAKRRAMFFPNAIFYKRHFLLQV